jgi:hypothetical protein
MRACDEAQALRVLLAVTDEERPRVADQQENASLVRDRRHGRRSMSCFRPEKQR